MEPLFLQKPYFLQAVPFSTSRLAFVAKNGRNLSQTAYFSGFFGRFP